jgi:hypothetical protein
MINLCSNIGTLFSGIILLIIAYIIELLTYSKSNKIIIGGNNSVKNDQILVPEQTLKALEYINNIVININKAPLFYEDIDFQYKYDNYGILKYNCHIGQRKLLLNEIQFLTYYCQNIDCIVYVGAAPCEHLTIIQELFPNNKYLLIDPNYCIIDAKSIYIYQNPEIISNNALKIINTYKKGEQHQRNGVKNLENMNVIDTNAIYNMINYKENSQKMIDIKKEFEKNNNNLFDRIKQSKEQIFIIQDYMTIELSKMLMKNQKEKHNILFISDLRTNFFQEGGPVDIDILFNDCLQIAILDILQPKFSMLKFHPPYYVEEWKHFYHNLSKHALYNSIIEPINYCNKLMNKDLLKEFEEKKHWNYEDELILLQPWGPTSSTEARLIVSQESVINKKFKYYDNEEWENKYFVIKYIRMYSYFNTYSYIINNPLIIQFGYCGCYDCYIEMSIIFQYINKNLPRYIPSKEDQENPLLIDKFIKLAKLINKNLRYDLKNNLNKHCKLHGHILKNNNEYYYLNINNNIYEWSSGKYAKIATNFKLNNNFDKQYENILKEYLIKDITKKK